MVYFPVRALAILSAVRGHAALRSVLAILAAVRGHAALRAATDLSVVALLASGLGALLSFFDAAAVKLSCEAMRKECKRGATVCFLENTARGVE